MTGPIRVLGFRPTVILEVKRGSSASEREQIIQAIRERHGEAKVVVYEEPEGRPIPGCRLAEPHWFQSIMYCPTATFGPSTVDVGYLRLNGDGHSKPVKARSAMLKQLHGDKPWKRR